MEQQPNPNPTPETSGPPQENPEFSTENSPSAADESTLPIQRTDLPFEEEIISPTESDDLPAKSPDSPFENPGFPVEDSTVTPEDFAVPQETDEQWAPPPPPFDPPFAAPPTPPPPIQGEVVRPAPKEKSNLFLRVVTALIGIPIVLRLVWHSGPLTFNLVIALLALLSLRELGGALRQAGFTLVRSLAYPALLALLCAQRFADSGSRAGALLIWTLPFVLLIALLIEGVLRYPQQRRPSLQSIALTLLSTVYVGLFLFVILLRSLKWPGLPVDSGFNILPGDGLPNLLPTHNLPALGPSLLWLTLIAVWAGDTVAYFAGRLMGKEKLTPLSPGKTWEGAVAGLTATIAVSVPVGRLMGIELRHGLALGVLIALAAPLGDLAESFWKRELGVKDLGGCLPGHGGILDRCDSLLFAVFAVYLYAQLILLG